MQYADSCLKSFAYLSSFIICETMSLYAGTTKNKPNLRNLQSSSSFLKEQKKKTKPEQKNPVVTAV